MLDIENREVGQLSLQDVSLRPTFGMMGAGEPTERTARGILEGFQTAKVNGRKVHFLQDQLFSGLPLPKIRVEAFFISTWAKNGDAMSCLDIVWLIDDLDELFSEDIKALLIDLKWSEYAEPFEI